MFVCEVYCFVPWEKGTLNMYMIKFFHISSALYIYGHITQCRLDWGHQRLLTKWIQLTQSADHYIVICVKCQCKSPLQLCTWK